LEKSRVLPYVRVQGAAELSLGSRLEVNAKLLVRSYDLVLNGPYYLVSFVHDMTRLSARQN